MTSASPPIPKPIPLPPVLRRFIQLLASLTLLCGLAELFCSSVLHLYARYAYPLLDEFFPDFFFFSAKFQHFRTLPFFTIDPSHPFMYPAPVALPYALFYLSEPRHALRNFLACMVGCFLLAAILLARGLVRRGLGKGTAALFTGATLLLSYPLWFVFHQANMEFVVWVILSLGLLAFFHQRPYAAAVCFGLATAMKLFPFVFLGLLLTRRHFRAIALALLVAVAVTVISLWIVYPDIRVSWHLIQAGVANFRFLYMLHVRPERGFDHSLFGLIKQLFPTLPPPSTVAPILSAYLLLAATAGTALYFLRIRKLPLTNQLLALTIASILLPPTSFDYTLLHLYAPWTLLVFFALRHFPSRTALPTAWPLPLAFACFAILFAPLTEFIVGGETVAGPIRAVVLLLLFWIALRHPFPSHPVLAPAFPHSPASPNTSTPPL